MTTHIDSTPSAFKNNPLKFCGNTIIILIMLVVFVSELRSDEKSFWFVFAPILIIICTSSLLMMWVKAMTTRLTVTDTSTTLRTGILSKYITEVWHKDVRNTTIRQSITQRIFGIGDITISSAANSDDEIKARGFSNITKIKAIIDSNRTSKQ